MDSKRIILTVLLTLFLVAQVSVVFALDDCSKPLAIEETSIPSEETDLEAIEQAIEESRADWIAGMTSVSGLSSEDKRKLCGLKGFPRTRDEIATEDISLIGAPTAFDWRDYGGDWTTGIKDQSDCGSCWAFGSLAAVEAQYNIGEGNPDMDMDLSEQYMVSCSPGSCDGWYLDDTMNWLRDHGTVDEACFPYTGWDAPCNPCSDYESRVWTIDGWGDVTPSIGAIKTRLLEAPLPTGMTVYTDFYSYSGGVYEHTWGSVEGGHLVTIVGWNDADQCWICKNSWSTDWGEDGWFRIKYGECDIEYDTVYITDVLPPTEKPTVSVTTDSFEYSPGDTMIRHLEIDNPTADPVTFNWYLGVPQFAYWGTIASASIPAGFSYSGDSPFLVGDWGSTPFGMVWYVELTDGTGEVLDSDAATCAYSPCMAVSKTSDAVGAIKESIRRAGQ